jgi:hypothetical protein
MKFASTRLIAADIRVMVAFYERVTGAQADWLAPQFAEIVTPAGTLAIGSADTVAWFREGSAEPGANRTAILEFMVEDGCPNRRREPIDAVNGCHHAIAAPNHCRRRVGLAQRKDLP